MSRLALSHIRKSYGSTPALVDASLAIEPGEIHAILGENGAGKTTLMNIVYGLIAPDSGEMTLEGKRFAPKSPREARDSGVGMVHQHFMLVPTLTVGENVLLGESPFSPFSPGRDFPLIEQRANQLGFKLPLSARVETLSVGEKQRVEIFKALWKGARLLVLDEPTAVLTPQETEELFVLLHDLESDGHSILFISHKLEEIENHCDRVTVIRRGTTVGCFPVGETDRKALSRLLLGRDLQPVVRSRDATPSTQTDGWRVECRGATSHRLNGSWTLAIPAGRITGVVGVEGNGQRELAELILGVHSDPAFAVLHGESSSPSGVRNRIAEGVGLISEDRQKTGLVLDFSILENLALKDVAAPPWSQNGWLTPKQARPAAMREIEKLRVHPPDLDAPASALSGGNQQKVVAAREISRPHDLLVAVNPTRGLDVGACEAVHKALIEDAERGRSVLLISTELDEVLALADDLYVLFDGRAALVPRESWDTETLGLAMVGVQPGSTAP